MENHFPMLQSMWIIEGRSATISASWIIEWQPDIREVIFISDFMFVNNK